MTHKTLILVMASILTIAASAQVQAKAPKKKTVQADQSLLLYPEGQNVDKGIALGPLESNGITCAEVDNGNGNIGQISEDARIDLYFPKKPNGQMVVVCPGGGYAFASLWNEGLYVANWMVDRGITVCVVKYRMPNGHWRVPLWDVQNAFRYCRAHAGEWGVNQIGVIGFSAGGHLAASASTLYVDAATRPDFSILIYPVITMDKRLTHRGTRENLIGKDNVWDNHSLKVDDYMASMKKFHELEERYSLQNNVNGNTPPTFMALSQDDKVVPVENTLLYYSQLLKFKVPAELHIYPKGDHGWGFSSERFVGEGNDNLGYARSEFDTSLERWLESIAK